MFETDHEPQSVLVTKSGEGITSIIINRPHKRNAVDAATSQKLLEAFLDFENDSTQKVCVFAGTNGVFCAGGDLQELAKQSDHVDNVEVAAPLNGVKTFQAASGGPMGPSRLMVKKPVICAIAGYAVAGGLELSLLADLRIVEDDAILGVFCRRFGVPLVDGGTVRLQAIVGLGRALDLILTGRAVSASEALSMGLATKVVPKGRALEEAMNLARSLLRFPQACMNADRESCYYAAYQAKSFDDALSHEFIGGMDVIGSESIPGAARFVGGMGRHGKI